MVERLTRSCESCALAPNRSHNLATKALLSCQPAYFTASYSLRSSASLFMLMRPRACDHGFQSGPTAFLGLVVHVVLISQ
jgi:hypothetical protein